MLRLQRSEDPIQEQARAIIERQAAKLTRLVDDLLEVSRVMTGRIRLQRETIDLRSVVERAVESQHALISRRKHELSVSLPAEPVWVFADAARMEQVVVNVLVNAAKYTDEGGRIGLSLELDGADAALRVKDTGVGIAPDLLPGIFDLFTQASRSLDRSQGGLGVGLTVVQRVVSLHGGSVEAFSEGLGRGSEFTVKLPVTSPPTMPPAEPDRPLGAACAPLRVLVVDDSKDTADSAALLLRRSGHDVRTAYSGDVVLAEALTFRPDAVLLDLGLPATDGYEVARRLRSDPDCKRVALIAVSGYGQERDRKRSREAGFDAHMTKPVDMQKVEEVLAALMKQRGR